MARSSRSPSSSRERSRSRSFSSSRSSGSERSSSRDSRSRSRSSSSRSPPRSPPRRRGSLSRDRRRRDSRSPARYGRWRPRPDRSPPPDRPRQARGNEARYRGRSPIGKDDTGDGVRGRGATRYRGSGGGGGHHYQRQEHNEKSTTINEPGVRSGHANGADAPEKQPEPARQDPGVAKPSPAGGVYVPPFKLAAMLAAAEQEGGSHYQRMTWDALRKSLNGLINKVNATNIKPILPEFFGENLVRGRGLFCRSLMKSQMASPAFTPVYAALVAVINTKFPEIGELLLHRVVMQFKRAYKRNDKPVCTAAATLLAHLANQQVAHELIALEVLMLLLESPSDDSVELAVSFITEVGALLNDLASSGLASVFDRLRAILHEGHIDKRTQFIIENLFALRKAGFEAQGHPAVPPELDLVEAEDQITHEVSLDDKLETNMSLDVFKEDPEFEQHEKEYEAIKREILGVDDDEEQGSDESEEDESEEEEEPTSTLPGGTSSLADAATGGPIQDLTQTDVINLRRTIYLTIMSALDFEEAGHKLLKMGIPPGQEMELCTMIIECCSQEKTFIKYYALLGERFAKLRREYCECFCECFVRQYALIHRLETNKLRNVAKFFAHLAATDAIPWSVLQCVRLTEEDTTSSSRIFIKIFFQELVEQMGLVALNRRLQDPDCAEWFMGIFPTDSAQNMRFSINFFTSIGLGGLTDRMRETLKSLPALLAAQRANAAKLNESESESDDSSSSDSESDSSDSDSSSSESSSSDGSETTSSSDSSSDEESPARRRKRSRSSGRGRKKSPPPARRGRREPSDSRCPPPARRGRGNSPNSRSPPPRRGHRDSPGSRSPPPRRARRDSPGSRSPPPRRARRDSPASRSPPVRRARRDSRSPPRR